MATPGSTQWSSEVWGPPGEIGDVCACKDHIGTAQQMATVSVGGVPIVVNERALIAFKVFDLLVRTYYGRTPNPKYTAAYVFRHKMHKCSRGLSNHSWGLACDLDWHLNRYGTVSPYLPAEFITAVEALRTVTGEKVFRWGGRWRTRDDMHFEITASPKGLASGIVGYESLEEIMARYVRLGEKSTYVGEMQANLLALGYNMGKWGPAKDGLDHDFGNTGKTRLGEFQIASGITEFEMVGSEWLEAKLGEYCGPRTWAAFSARGGTSEGTITAMENRLTVVEKREYKIVEKE